MTSLSVVTVCYNASSTIRTAIESVVTDKPSKLEYIVVDGGSRDGTVPILESFRHQIDVLISERDGGIYDAMNKGVAAATGDFVAFLNADDRYLPGKLRTLMKALDEPHPRLDVVYGDWLGVAADGSTRLRSGDHRVTWKHRLCHQAMAVRRSMMIGPLGFDLSYRLCADYDLILRLREGGARFFHVPQPLVSFIETGVSNTLLREAATESILIAFRRLGPLRFIPFAALTMAHCLRVASGAGRRPRAES